jgi:hypothetical protein
MPPRPKRPDLYDELEPPIRPLVRLLRNNGFNSTCSCGHGMWVELDVYGYMDDLERIRNLLLEHGYRDFTITGDLRVMDMWPVRRAKVYLGDYLPPDDTSVREYASKISCFKEEAERLHQQSYRLRERNKRLKEEVRRLRRGSRGDRKGPGD